MLPLISYLDVNKHTNIVEQINRAVSLSAQNAESHWLLVTCACNSYSRTLQFSCILYEVWVTARFDVLFNSLNVTKTTNIFLAHFRFWNKLQIFLMILGIMHAASPLPKSPLISSYQQQKHLANDFNLFLRMVGAGCILSIPLLAPACIPTRSCIRASF